MFYTPNSERSDIRMSVVRTFRYEAEEEHDPRDGTACVELKTADGRYGLVCSAEQFAALATSE